MSGKPENMGSLDGWKKIPSDTSEYMLIGKRNGEPAITGLVIRWGDGFVETFGGFRWELGEPA